MNATPRANPLVLRRLAGLFALWLVVTECPGAPADEVLAVEQARVAALVNNDLAALERIFASDLTYAHSNGTVESKAEYLATLRSGRLKYKALEHANLMVRIYGDAAVMQGTSKVRAVAGGVESTVHLRFIMVYVRDAGRWRLAAWQSTRRPE